MISVALVWLLTLAVLAAWLYTAEAFFPSHGLFSVLATACVAIAVVLCFALDRRLGLGAIIALAVLGPVGLTLGLALWQRTPVGRRMVLTAVTGDAPRPAVLVGATGITLTELRPMGECEFAAVRVQARSEMGDLVAPGQPVKIIKLQDTVAVVRAVGSTIT